MPCEAFEDLLGGYKELSAMDRHSVDLHLAACADCRERLEALAEIDRELDRLYQGFRPRPGFHASVVTRANASTQRFWRPAPPSAWPEVLDFCGWAAIVAIAALLAATAAAQAGITL